MVAMILLRALNRDITRYNALSSYDLDLDPSSTDIADSVQDDSGWKLVHGEVFRAPKLRMWLCITVGTGAQMAAMCGVTLCESCDTSDEELSREPTADRSPVSPSSVFALLGFLSPSNRGALSTVMIVCWTLFGVRSSPSCPLSSADLFHLCSSSPATSRADST